MTLNQDIPAYRNACLDCEAIVGQMFTRKRLRTKFLLQGRCSPWRFLHSDPQEHDQVVHCVCAGQGIISGEEEVLPDWQ